MSARVAAKRQILLNITNMDDQEGERRLEKCPGGEDDGLRDVEGVQLGTTPAAVAAASVAPPRGRKSNDGVAGNDNVASLTINSGKFESDHEACHPEDCSDVAAKKRKTRRGKPKHRKLKPYSKQQSSYDQRLRARTTNRLSKTGRQPPAPYNTTQFLMEDHSDLPVLEQKLAGATATDTLPLFQKPPLPPRTRDSSFSVDSDQDYFYSSPEDEEEFLTKEFSSAYEDLHAERLSTLTKTELIQEYIQLEGKVDLLTKRLRGRNFHQMEEWENESRNSTGAEIETAKKLKLCQQRIDDLIQQNEQLRRENETLRTARPVYSVETESDSDSSSTGKLSACSCSVPKTGGSPVTGTVQARREKGQRRGTSVSSVDSESDSDSSSTNSSSCSCRGGSPKAGSLINGNATPKEVHGLPT